MITPLEIENKKFAKQVVNGYNVEEVDEFLDLVTADYERMYKENTEYREKIEQLNEDIAHYKTIEGTLQSTLLMAQSTAEEVKNVAKQQAEQIIIDAKNAAQNEAVRLEQEIMVKKKELEDARKTI